mmetsp:Transcript_2280/g.7635  ORF Transcript_2280/g.7635 Transcript_2280/m.7635 type:complete len:672 (-) Transcript_2280:483-2498(-)
MSHAPAESRGGVSIERAIRRLEERVVQRDDGSFDVRGVVREPAVRRRKSRVVLHRQDAAVGCVVSFEDASRKRERARSPRHRDASISRVGLVLHKSAFVAGEHALLKCVGHGGADRRYDVALKEGLGGRERARGPHEGHAPQELAEVCPKETIVRVEGACIQKENAAECDCGVVREGGGARREVGAVEKGHAAALIGKVRMKATSVGLDAAGGMEVGDGAVRQGAIRAKERIRRDERAPGAQVEGAAVPRAAVGGRRSNEDEEAALGGLEAAAGVRPAVLQRDVSERQIGVLELKQRRRVASVEDDIIRAFAAADDDVHRRKLEATSEGNAPFDCDRRSFLAQQRGLEAIEGRDGRGRSRRRLGGRRRHWRGAGWARPPLRRRGRRRERRRDLRVVERHLDRRFRSPDVRLARFARGATGVHIRADGEREPERPRAHRFGDVSSVEARYRNARDLSDAIVVVVVVVAVRVVHDVVVVDHVVVAADAGVSVVDGDLDLLVRQIEVALDFQVHFGLRDEVREGRSVEGDGCDAARVVVALRGAEQRPRGPGRRHGCRRRGRRPRRDRRSGRRTGARTDGAVGVQVEVDFVGRGAAGEGAVVEVPGDFGRVAAFFDVEEVAGAVVDAETDVVDLAVAVIHRPLGEDGAGVEVGEFVDGVVPAVAPGILEDEVEA